MSILRSSTKKILNRQPCPPDGISQKLETVANQPYPGSYQFQQQAPPIASKSRGYHLQFQAGYFTDEDVESWKKKKRYPYGYVVSVPINVC